MGAMTNGTSGLRYRLNNGTVGVVATIVLLTPMALGGNRPAIWALTGFILFAWATVYFGRLGFAAASPRASTSRYGFIAGLFWVMAAYMILQILPVADLLPRSWLTLPGGIDPGMRISLTPGDTALALLRCLAYGMLFYLCLQVAANSARSAVLLKILFWIIAAHAFYGLLLFFEFDDAILFTDKWAYRGSATGGFVNRNSYATFLAIGATIGATLVGNLLFMPRSDGRPRRWVDLIEGGGGIVYILIGCLFIAATLALTTSRMGFFAAFCGSLSAFLLSAWQARRRFGAGALALGLLAGAAMLAGLAFLYGGVLVERLGTVESSANIRADLYWQVWSMVADRPLLGFGGSSFEYVFPLYHDAPVSFDAVWDKTHSTYLSLWVSYGIFFGTLPLLIMAWCLVRLFGLLRREGREDPAVTAAIGAIVVAALQSSPTFSWRWWPLVSVGSRDGRASRREADDQESFRSPAVRRDGHFRTAGAAEALLRQAPRLRLRDRRHPRLPVASEEDGEGHLGGRRVGWGREVDRPPRRLCGPRPGERRRDRPPDTRAPRGPQAFLPCRKP